MENLSTFLEKKVQQLLKELFPAEDLAPFFPPDITQSTQEKFGHYQCNLAMKLAKVFKQNPRALAEKIVQKWEEKQESEIEKIEVAGPGFINITFNSNFLSQELALMARDSRLGVAPLTKKEKVIVEFSSPNVAKELHVGHLRSTIIGESLARLFEFLGYDVLRLNHIGDWGTQFGMLIAYLKENEPDILQKEEKTDLSSLMHWYREAKKLFDVDPDFKKRAQIEVVNLQAKEKDSIAFWEKICAISRKGFQEIYDVLDVSLEERGESFYNPMLSEIVKDFEEQELVSVSEGAKCVFLEGFVNKEGEPLPLILQKSDGGYNYATTDVSAIKHRVFQEKASRILYVVDSGQHLHFQMVFGAATKAQYLDRDKVEVKHIPFGVVLGPDGKKFKTRSGKTEKLIDLLNEAVRQAKNILKERMREATEEELEEKSQILGIDAVKYADLSCHRVKDYVFSYERMLKFEGNTAAYLLYSYVRIQGIKRKIGKITLSPIAVKEPSEIALGLHLRQFGEVLEMAAKDCLPNRLADYLYGLAEKFHLFFRDCRVQGSEEEGARLSLCELTATILKQGLHILGLKTLDRM